MTINFKVPRIFRISTFVAASIVALGFTACKDDGDNGLPLPQKAETAVLNLLQDIDKINLHAGTVKLNSSDIDNGVLSAYLPVNAGEQNLSVFQIGETDTLVSHRHTFGKDKSYSVFVIGDADDAELVVAEDNLSSPASGKVKVRFANLVNEEETLDLWKGGDEDALVEDAAYKAVGTFVEIDAEEEASFSVKVNGEDDDVAVLEDLNLEAGKIYTIYAQLKDVEGELQTVLAITANK